MLYMTKADEQLSYTQIKNNYAPLEVRLYISHHGN